ncbi:Uu.00g037450.m01.CDS01 [Anthostomella pinea]|uniref:Uu.00g037450.m01.CDS01 n=1 Tax=Anthostomella pinea TaxID=933095 RepID=A0AAI8VA94_9PEZI|nr:Uu.00g037450.m01.CDS01 [Anthostomella pinea]
MGKLFSFLGRHRRTSGSPSPQVRLGSVTMRPRDHPDVENYAELIEVMEVAIGNIHECTFTHLVHACGGRCLETAAESGALYGKRHYAAAVRHLDTILDYDDQRSVSALMLMAMYCLRNPVGPGSWTYGRLAIMVAIAFGLHRKISIIKHQNMDSEIRKRLFWETHAFDRQVSIPLGRPFASTGRDIDEAATAKELAVMPELRGMKLTVLLSLALAAAANAASQTFTNTGRLLFDVDGNQLDLYGAKINYFNGSYYFYGNSFSTTGVAFGIKSYSSVDLEHWKYEGFLFDPYSSNSPCNQPGACGRPHIVYNNATQTYVLWANAGSNGYQVATSSQPAGPFTFLPDTAAIDPQFTGLQPADFAVESFGDQAYIVFSALNFVDPRAGSIWPPIFQTMHISELTADFTNTTQVSYPISSNATDLIDQEPESQDIFMRDGMVYVGAGNTCGYCNGTVGLVYRSSSIQGPWERQIIAGYSCNGQLEGVLPLTDPTSGEVTEVWHSTSVPGGPRVGFGGHIFQPLTFNSDGSVEDLDCAATAKFEVNFQEGTQEVATGAATMAGDKTPLDAAYTPVCDSDSFDLFQTWTASQSGTLTNVSVNIAGAGIQAVPLTLTVFKFDSYADLIAPEYKYTAMGNVSYTGSTLSFVFNTTSVPITSNATVGKGDLLGLAITGPDFAPYCHLEYDTAKNSSDFVLYQRGAGQNSWRGLQGKTSVVYERVGKSVKMFATYA